MRKSYRWAATKPIDWFSAAFGPPVINVNRSIANGSQTTLKVTTKNETFLPLLSCAYVYAMPSTSAVRFSLRLSRDFTKFTLSKDDSTKDTAGCNLFDTSADDHVICSQSRLY